MLSAKRVSESRLSKFESMISKSTNESWSKEEDNLLIELRNRIRTWVEISTYFQNKNPKQCAYRIKKLGIGACNESWTRDQELKLLQLIEQFGGKIECIKPFFKDKTEEEIRIICLKYNARNMISFSPAEDSEILNIYYNSKVNMTSQRILMIKGIENVKRRLKLLLKNKGEELKHNFDINSLISMNYAISNKETAKSSDSNFNDSVNPSFVSEIHNQASFLQSTKEKIIDEQFKLSLSEVDFQKEDYSYYKSERRLSSQSLSRCGPEFDFDEYNILQEHSRPAEENNHFEKTFLSTFRKEFRHEDDEFFCEIDLYSSRTVSIECLIKQKKTLESIMERLSVISHEFNESIEAKIQNCKLKENDKFAISNLISDTLGKENELAQSVSEVTLRLEDRLNESQYIQNLFLAISQLKSLIETIKLKLKLVSKILEEI